MAEHEEPVLVAVEDGIMTVTLNRPERLNAVNPAMHRGLEEALRRAGADESVRVVLLRGAGRAFCSGGDVEMFAEGVTAPPSPAQRVLAVSEGRVLLDTVLAVRQPIVAAVQGYAFGLGATIALFSDVVIAAEDAAFADSHVNVGLVAGDGGAIAFPLLMSMAQAKYYLMTGERISGTEAARIGLVLKAVPAAELDAEALGVARKLAALAPMAVAGTKATLNVILRERVAAQLEYGLLREGATFLSDDHREAAKAFVEKRPAVFHGR